MRFSDTGADGDGGGGRGAVCVAHRLDVCVLPDEPCARGLRMSEHPNSMKDRPSVLCGLSRAS